ncbi:MAG TPA: 16S rRNA (cytosine(1402)-N(4))-methyltransferase RsmH [Arenimonas sp.]|nr:16S rRNA (cytosine(1402)-N(4))-methyltransferase RsmH [Arenimonas sp.]
MAIGTSVQQQTPRHLPVMWKEVMDGLQIKPYGVYLDGTFGRGGHTRGILEALESSGSLLVMDKDPEAIAVANALQNQDARLSVYHGSFAEMTGWDKATNGLDGILFDLGVSSPQLDVAERGFSFRLDGPLDMRMNTEVGMSASEWLANASEKEISDVLWLYGEEKMSRKIARAIVAKRTETPFTSTTQLAEFIAGMVGRGAGKIHPATRSFQAIRIFINRELADLEIGLQAAHDCLKPGGRLAVISFHSLEDRIVKQFIAKHAKAPPGNRRSPDVPDFTATLIDIGGAQKAGENELAENPRARSAVLRVAEKVMAS